MDPTGQKCADPEPSAPWGNVYAREKGNSGVKVVPAQRPKGYPGRILSM